MRVLELVLPMTSREVTSYVLSCGFLGLGTEIGKLEDTMGRPNKAQAIKLKCNMDNSDKTLPPQVQKCVEREAATTMHVTSKKQVGKVERKPRVYPHPLPQK